ncbi:MurR/RpiR family transcriptional regulator [Leeia oryzae]|uniref:MurR/RpiR family transcriptional regulator n=1 Tax=Leeia oryzae TaxID=356662 RepID=UPI00036A3441|nr:MurR/RpiR family transcriptional regulator [Leeia oryzae]
MSSEKLTELLESSFTQFTPTGKRIASYLLANMLQIPFETADSIARQTNTTGISVGRFLRQIGFQNLDDLKQSLRGTGQTWLMTDRLGSFRNQDEEEDVLGRSLKLELQAIEHVYQLARSPEFQHVVDRIVAADAVFVLGIQSTRGISNAFFSHLEYIRPNVFYADGLSGTYVECLNSGFENPYLILTDFRAYSSITKKLCAAACKRNLNMALITEYYCTWARDYPVDLLQINVDVGQFWDSLAPLTVLFNLLVSGVVKATGPDLEQRLQENKALQKELGQFDL